MIKLLHTADIHLDSPLRALALRDEGLRARVQIATRIALTRIVDAALSEAVTALLIAGDLFDGAERSAKTAAFLTAQMDRLRTAGIAVFYIKGNHDAENPITGQVDLPGNVHVFDGRGGKVQIEGTQVWVHGVSFSGRHAPESLLPKFAAPVPGAVNIAMLHTSLAGAQGHDTYAPCAVSDLAAMGFDYWALGHIHKRQVHSAAPWIVMPGIPQGRDIGEAGPKSATLIEIGEHRIDTREVPTSSVEFVEHTLDISGLDEDAIRTDLRAAMRDLAGAIASDTGLVRLTLTGHSLRKWQILRDQDMWTETAQAAALETGTLWLEKTRFDLQDDAASSSSGTAVDELDGMITAIRQEPAMQAELATRLEAILAELPAQRRAALTPDEDSAKALAQDLAERGTARVLAAMKGAAE